MLEIKKQYLILYLWMASLSTSLYAFDLDQLNHSIVPEKKAPVSVLDHQDEFDFTPDPIELLKLNLELASFKLSKKDLAKSVYRHYDIDGFENILSNDEFLMMTKTFFIFPNTLPDFFSLERVTSEAYCKVAFDDNKREQLDGLTVYSEKKVPFQTMAVRIHFLEYNHQTNVFKTKGTEKINALLELAPLGLDKLDRIISTYSSENDISMGSRGSRTINYYYNIGNRHTLHASIKIVTFKKEATYSKFFLKPLNIWKLINSQALHNQKIGTRDSLRRLSHYIASFSEHNELIK